MLTILISKRSIYFIFIIYLFPHRSPRMSRGWTFDKGRIFTGGEFRSHISKRSIFFIYFHTHTRISLTISLILYLSVYLSIHLTFYLSLPIYIPLYVSSVYLFKANTLFIISSTLFRSSLSSFSVPPALLRPKLQALRTLMTINSKGEVRCNSIT